MKRQDKKMNKGFPKVEEQEIKLGKKSTDDIQGTEDHAKYQEGQQTQNGYRRRQEVQMTEASWRKSNRKSRELG